MKIALAPYFLLIAIVLCPLLKASAVARQPMPDNSTAATPASRGHQNQSGANEFQTQAKPDKDAPKASRPESSEAVAQRFYDSATNLYAAGNYDEAVSAFLQAAKLEPDNPQTHYGLGMAYTKSKYYKEAADSFKQAVKFKPDWPEANFRAGVMAHVLGNKSEATEAYNTLLKLNSPLANTLFGVINEPASTASSPVGAKLGAQSKPGDGVPASVPSKEAGTNNSTQRETAPPTNETVSPQPANDSTKDVSTPPAASSAPVSDQTLMTIYRVGVGDILDIRLLNSTVPRSTLFTVVDGGLIDVPIAGGPINVAGLTTEEIQSRIAAELKRRAVEVNALVSVGVRQYASHAVIVAGLVANPGTRFLRREAIPLYVLMAEVQPRLDAGRITVLRAGGEGRIVDLGDANALGTLILPGDVLNVGPRPQEFYYIAGRVNYPGQKPFQPGITLLQAILAAGGTAQNENNIDLSREGTDLRLTTTRFSLKDIKAGKLPDPKLQPGDRIEVVR